MNLVEGLLQANRKTREHILQLDETANLFGLTNDPGLAISREVSRALIAQTDEAIGSGDILKMLAAAAAHGLGAAVEGNK